MAQPAFKTILVVPTRPNLTPVDRAEATRGTHHDEEHREAEAWIRTCILDYYDHCTR